MLLGNQTHVYRELSSKTNKPNTHILQKNYKNLPVARNDVLWRFSKLRNKCLVGIEICSSTKFSSKECNTFIGIIFVLY